LTLSINDIQYKSTLLYAECRDYLNVMLSVIHYAECHYAECHYAECHYAECLYAECYYTECRYAECRGAAFLSFLFNNN
jgi:hypothetical protein